MLSRIYAPSSRTHTVLRLLLCPHMLPSTDRFYPSLLQVVPIVVIITVGSLDRKHKSHVIASFVFVELQSPLVVIYRIFVLCLEGWSYRKRKAVTSHVCMYVLNRIWLSIGGRFLVLFTHAACCTTVSAVSGMILCSPSTYSFIRHRCENASHCTVGTIAAEWK